MITASDTKMLYCGGLIKIRAAKKDIVDAVSYTHLALPTELSFCKKKNAQAIRLYWKCPAETNQSKD